MVRANSPAVCTAIKSKPRRAKRSLSGTSLDVKGSVVMEKVWMFDGMNDGKSGLSAEQLSEEDTGKDEWCEKHYWFLYTNLISVQQCAKCCKRILTKRLAYKCTECKRLCHLKCAIKEEDCTKGTTDLKISSANCAMDFQNFVTSDEIQTCRYTRKTSNHGRRGRQKIQELSNTNNSIEEMEIHEEPKEEQYRPSHQEMDLSKLSELHSTASSQSQTKQRLNSMKHGFVKRCRSIKNKVKTLKDKVHGGEGHKSSDDQTLPSSSSTTSSSAQNTADQVSEQQKAWVRSPVRTRLREKQLEFRRESVRAKTRVRRNNSARLRMFENSQSNDQTVHAGRFERSDRGHHPDLDLIQGRMEVIEKRVLELEIAIPQEIQEWHQLKKKFLTTVGYVGTSREDRMTDDMGRDSVHETHPKHIEAMQSATLSGSASSGTTSDDVYVVPDNPCSSSHDDNDGCLIHTVDKISSAERVSHTKNHVIYSPVTSLHDDSMPSGIPNKFRLSMHENSQGAYNEHQTSTPVTNREISFRSASKQYETTHKVCHTNITHVNLDHSYTEPSHNSTAEIKLHQRTSIEVEPSEKVLSPEQEAVKSFLDKRKRFSTGRLSNGSGQSFEGRRSPSDFMSPMRTCNRSPYNLRSRSSLPRAGKDSGTSPKIGANQASFYASPPVASSTFCENGTYVSNLNADMSPVLLSNKDDFREDSDDNELKFGVADKNASSASNFSYTFRNDSQMIQTNAEEDLPGYTRNHVVNRGTEEHGREMRELLSEEYCTGNDRFTYETDGMPSRSTAHVTFATHDNMSTPITTTTDDALSLTNVTAFTGDLANSFADSGHGLCKSRWINKDVLMFDRDEKGNPIKPKISLSRDRIDERGDRRKPPIPKKQYSSNSQIDYLREAEKKLDMYKSRRSVESSETRGSSDNVHHPSSTDPFSNNAEVNKHIIETEFVPETISKLQMTPSYQSRQDTEPTHSSPSPIRKQMPYNLQHGDLKTKSRSPSPRKGVDKRYSSSREPSPTNSDRSRSSSPAKSQRFCRGSKATKHSNLGSNTNLKNTGAPSPKQIDSTTEFEEIERRLREESHLCRRSQSLTNLQQRPLSVSGYSHKKSMSCTNSVDGETKSIINDSAKYHFLHDKGMIKISSPSLKIMNGSSSASRKKYEPEYNHIDEEGSDMLQSGSESNLSGVIVDNNFHINGTSRNTSEADSRQTRSDFTQTGRDSETCEMRHYRDQEREMFEEYLTTADENQEEWDNVLSWINREHAAAGNAEVEHELEMLMEQEHAEVYEREIRTGEGLQSPVNDSVYYSFIGQSEELRGVLSPVRSSIQRSLSYQLEESFQIGPGLMHIILNGSIQDLEHYLNSDRTISESEIKEALQWALEERNLSVAFLLLEDICKLIRGAEDEMCVDVFPAYLEQDRWQPVIVILTKQNYEGDWDLFMGLPVYRRRYDLVSDEAKTVVNSDYVKSNPLTAGEVKTVRRAIRGAKLLNSHHRKLTVVNACPCRSRKGGKVLEKGLCIVVHCVIKSFIPFDEEPYPREIQGIPVDVREGYFLSGVATPTVTPQRRELLNNMPTDNESETESSVTNDSIGSKCRTGSERHRTSRSSSEFSLKNDNAGKSTETYKPAVCDDSNAREVNLYENNEELSSSKGDSTLSDEVIEKAPHSSEEENVQCVKKGSLLIGSGITTLSVEGLGPLTTQGHGTVGGFVQLLGGDIGFITCAHITGNCKDNSEIKFHVRNPSADENVDKQSSHYSVLCGEVVQSVLQPGTSDISGGEPALNDATGVDAAVVKLTDPTMSYAPGKFVDIKNEQLQRAGFDGLNLPIFSGGGIVSLSELSAEQMVGDVIKIGATTGLTRGRLYADGTYVRHIPHLGHSSYELHNQIEVVSVDNDLKFFDHGDSGCLVFICSDKTDLRCLGLAVGCTSYDTCIVTPIKIVLDKLNLLQNFVKST